MSTDPISKYDSHALNYCTNKHDTYPFISPLSPSSNLKGRYLLVTGASKGIGRAIAISFARAGAAGIALLARSSLSAVEAEVAEAARAANHLTPRLVSVCTDVTLEDQVAAASEAVKNAFDGKLDAMVLNAGVLEPIARIGEQNPSEWWKAYETSVLGSFLCLHYFIPMMRETKGGLGTVVGMSSIGSTFTGPGFSGLQTAKLAMNRLMEFVNAEYNSDADGYTPLLAFSIHPGAIAHPERTDFPQALHDMSIDTVELSADTTTWLIRERRDWIAGRFINCNWDMEEFLSRRPEIEKRDLLKVRLAMGGEDWSKA